MRFLDLFCCCGGISKGFSNVYPEAAIQGVDNKANHDYPFHFMKADVFDLPLSFFRQFDLIHASPPCQFYIPTNKWRENEYPDLISKTRNLLNAVGKPYTIENVQGSPLRQDLVLCGEMFGLRVLRHRIFEISGFYVQQPRHRKHKLSVMDGTAVGVYSGGINPGFWGDKRKQEEFRKKRKDSHYACVAGHGGNSYSFHLKDWQKAMGIDWVDNKEHLTQMIPPKYYEYIAKQFNSFLTLDHLLT